jgi:hypothetical protein
MTQKLLILAFYLIISLQTFSQLTFDRSIGGPGFDNSEMGAQTADGGYVMVGYTSDLGPGGTDFFMTRMNPNGDTLWTRIYAGTGFEDGRSVEQTSDGGFIVCGYSSNIPTGFRLIKTDAAGDTLWTRVMSGSGFTVRQTSDGGYIATGGTISGGWDLYLVRLDNAGNVSWANQYGGNYLEVGYDVRQTADGGFIAIGVTESFGAGDRDIYIVKTDAAGVLQWSKTIGEALDDFGHSIIQTTDGGYALTAEAYSFATGGYDSYVAKLDAAGNLTWSWVYFDAFSGTISKGICETLDGGLAVTGYRSLPAQSILFKTDAGGNVEWARAYGGNVSELSNWVQQTADTGFVMFGFTESFGAGSIDLNIIKTDSLGNSCLVDTLTLSQVVPISVIANAAPWELSGFTLSYPQISVLNPAVITTTCGVTDTIPVSSTVPAFDQAEVTVYPNPFSDNVTFSFSHKTGSAYSILIYDVQGRIIRVLNDLSDEKVTMNRDAMPAGFYTFRLMCDGVPISFGKLVVG